MPTKSAQSVRSVRSRVEAWSALVALLVIQAGVHAGKPAVGAGRVKGGPNGREVDDDDADAHFKEPVEARLGHVICRRD